MVRVIYKAGGDVAVIHPVADRPLDEIFEKAVKGTDMEGLPYDDMEASELPAREHRDKWRGAKGQGVRIDHTVETPVERKEKLSALIEVELKKPNPDPVAAMRLMRKLEKGEF